MSNSELKLDYYPGRRLKAVNSSHVGQGEAIAKSMALLLVPRPGVMAQRAANACQYLDDHGEKGVLTLSYSAKLDFDPKEGVEAQDLRANILRASRYNDLSATPMRPNPESKGHHDKLRGELGDICVAARVEGPKKLPVADASGGAFASFDDGILLSAREPGVVSATFSNWIDANPNEQGAVCAEQLPPYMTKSAPYADSRGDYTIPMPRARAFGESVVDLQFEESGALASVKYGSKSGIAGAGNALTALADTFLPTEEIIAKRLKAEADVIAGQQRLLKCRLDPKECK